MEERVFIEKVSLIKRKTWISTYFVVLIPLLLRPEAIAFYKDVYQTGIFDGTSCLNAIGYPFVIGFILTIILELLMGYKGTASKVTVDQQSLTLLVGDQETFIAFSAIDQFLYRRNNEGDLITLILKVNKEKFVLEDFDDMENLYRSLKLRQDVIAEKAKSWDLTKVAIAFTAIALVLWVNQI